MFPLIILFHQAVLYNFELNSCIGKMNCDDKYACSLLLENFNIPLVYDWFKE